MDMVQEARLRLRVLSVALRGNDGSRQFRTLPATLFHYIVLRRMIPRHFCVAKYVLPAIQCDVRRPTSVLNEREDMVPVGIQMNI